VRENDRCVVIVENVSRLILRDGVETDMVLLVDADGLATRREGAGGLAT
jgi:hypothetical protein